VLLEPPVGFVCCGVDVGLFGFVFGLFGFCVINLLIRYTETTTYPENNCSPYDVQ